VDEMSQLDLRIDSASESSSLSNAAASRGTGPDDIAKTTDRAPTFEKFGNLVDGGVEHHLAGCHRLGGQAPQPPGVLGRT
jgi:hypothetical protein